MRFDLDAIEIRALLAELDRRLRLAGVPSGLYVVGGAAIALHLPRSPRRTQDIDGVLTDERAARVAEAMAQDLGLPEGWLSEAARPFIPRYPTGVLEPPGEPGLAVHLAPLEDLLAMKLVAGRARDRDDIVALAGALGIGPEEAIAMTLAAYGAEALDTLSNLAEVSEDAHRLIGGAPPS